MNKKYIIIIVTGFSIFICLCASCSCLVASFFFTENSEKPKSVIDYLWVESVSKELRELGYTNRDVIIDGNNPPSQYRTISVQVGNIVDGEEIRAYNLVETVHKVVYETYETATITPAPVHTLYLLVLNDERPYTVTLGYESVKQYFQGEISQEEYFSRWWHTYAPLDIAPP